MFIKVSVARCSHWVIFYFKEKFCVLAVTSASLWLARCLLSEAFQRPCRKYCISGYIWHKSFIQTVKCSFFNEIIVYQSFYRTLLTFSYLLLQGQVLFCTLRRFSKSLARCLFQNVPKILQKKLYLQLYLTQIVHSNGKMHFLFLFVFHMLQVACKMFICQKRSKDLVKKIISLVIFDTNRSFKR